MKALWLVAVLLVSTPLVANAASTPKPRSGTSKRFVSTDRSFRFSYPDTYRLYTGKQDLANAASLSYIPPCSESDVACVVYPPERYAGTNFGAASFEVREIARARNKRGCETPEIIAGYPEWALSGRQAEKNINGVGFVHGERDGVALGHSGSTDVYRTFRRGKCYELRVNITQSSFANYEPGTVREFTDSQAVLEAMDRILDSFTFLK